MQILMRVLAMLAAALVLAAPVQAQNYPSKPIRFVVGYSPGGGTDIMARLLATKVSESIGQSVVVENRPGASGTLAAAQVAKSPADGYTIMMGVISLNTILPHLMPNLPFDPLKDFTPVTLTASVPHIIVVHPSLPVNTLAELIAYAKANPGKLNFPSAGNGTTPHIAAEIFMNMTGTSMVHIPYKSTGQSMPDLLAGRLSVGFDTYPTAAPYVRLGKLRPLAVTSARRLPEFPDVPTAEEAGLPGYNFATWYGVFAPGGAPAPVVDRLHAEFAKALVAEDIKPQLAKLGVDDTVTRTPEEFAALVRADLARFAKVVKDANISLK